MIVEQVLPAAVVAIGLCFTTPLGIMADAVSFQADPKMPSPGIWEALGGTLVMLGVMITILEPGRKQLFGETLVTRDRADHLIKNLFD